LGFDVLFCFVFFSATWIIMSGAGGGGGGGGNSLENDVKKYAYGVEFKAKLIGFDEIDSMSGDKMALAEDSMARLKAAVTASKEHKLKIIVEVSFDGVKIYDEKNRKLVHHHEAHQIVFIAFDVKEPRACGYFVVLGNLTYRFIGLKSMEKTSESIVQAIQELICLSYELKVQQMSRSKVAPEISEEAKSRSASYRSQHGLPPAPEGDLSEIITQSGNSDALKQLEEQDMNKVHGQLEALHRLMDKGDALGDGYQGYENKIQEHRQGKISSTVLARFGNQDNIDTVLGRVERIWFPGIAEDKLRVKWKVPQVGRADTFVVRIAPAPTEEEAPSEVTVEAHQAADVTFWGLEPNTIYTVYVSSTFQGRVSNPCVGTETTLPVRSDSL